METVGRKLQPASNIRKHFGTSVKRYVPPARCLSSYFGLVEGKLFNLILVIWFGRGSPDKFTKFSLKRLVRTGSLQIS